MIPVSLNKTLSVTESAFGTCGELVQGCIDGQNFMITFPVSLHSNVEATFISGGEIIVSPSYKKKAAKAAEILLSYIKELGLINKDLGVSLNIESDLIEGKGMASSSADIVAVCRAVSKLCNYPITPWQISKISVSIEPSDGVMYESSVVYDFFEGKLLQEIGPIMPMSLVTIDFGGTVDTVEFKRIPYTQEEEKQIFKAYHLAIRGIKSWDIQLLGEATTISALVNQRRHYKKELNNIINLIPELEAYGVAVAHSGSIISLLFDFKNYAKIELAKSKLEGLFPKAIIQEFNVLSKESLSK